VGKKFKKFNITGVTELEKDSGPENGEELLNILIGALEKLQKSDRLDSPGYRSYLHGQVYGLATALRILYPGHGNLGERAALAVRPVITEHVCHCEEKDTI